MSTSKGPDNSDRRLPAALSLLHLNLMSLMGVVNLPVSMDPLASVDSLDLLFLEHHHW